MITAVVPTIAEFTHEQFMALPVMQYISRAIEAGQKSVAIYTDDFDPGLSTLIKNNRPEESMDNPYAIIRLTDEFKAFFSLQAENHQWKAYLNGEYASQYALIATEIIPDKSEEHQELGWKNKYPTIEETITRTSISSFALFDKLKSILSSLADTQKQDGLDELDLYKDYALSRIVDAISERIHVSPSVIFSTLRKVSDDHGVYELNGVPRRPSVRVVKMTDEEIEKVMEEGSANGIDADKSSYHPFAFEVVLDCDCPSCTYFENVEDEDSINDTVL